jgi:hypothetical protein
MSDPENLCPLGTLSLLRDAVCKIAEVLHPSFDKMWRIVHFIEKAMRRYFHTFIKKQSAKGQNLILNR